MPLKSNPDYWAVRQKQLDKQLERNETALNKKLAALYDKQESELKKEIASYYQTYGEDKVIQYRTLMEQLSAEDKTLLLERMDAFADKYPQYRDLLPIRESIYKLNRLEGLQQSVKMQQLECGAIEQSALESHLKEQAAKAANAAAESLGFGSKFYSSNSDIIKNTINARWVNGENFSDRIWNNRQKLSNYINRDFAQEIARGDSYNKVIHKLQDRFGVSKQNAFRLVYTEGTYVQGEAQANVWESMGIEKYTYHARFSQSHVCESCKALDGKEFYLKHRQPGTNFIPMHPGCHCYTTVSRFNIDDYVKKHGEDKWSNKQLLKSNDGNDKISMNKQQSLKTDLQLFAHIPEEKFTKYALDPKRQPDKARAFKESLGYSTDNYHDLIDNIYEHIDESKFVEKGDEGYGMKYEYIMHLHGVNGKEANVLTAWIKDSDDVRLTSAYVTKRKVLK